MSSALTAPTDYDVAWIKLALLSGGLTMSADFRSWFASSAGVVRRRNFYNSPGHSQDNFVAPQEIRLGRDLPVTVAVNSYGPSAWQLKLDQGGDPIVVCEEACVQQSVAMFSNLAAILDDDRLRGMCNLYGGSALSFFSPRSCYFFADGTACRFCSLAGTASETREYAARLTPLDVHEAVAQVVATEDRARLSQIMIVGGNERNLDRGFLHQAELVRAAASALREAGLDETISVHLIVMPPRDLQLLDELGSLGNIHVGFNLEVWDPQRFAEIAPGKDADYGRGDLLKALYRLREVVGPYRAHSILIAGLEAPSSTLTGARYLAGEGISPIINAYHSDRHSALGLTIRPRYRDLAAIAADLHDLYGEYPIQPYWKGCGRNALDFEAATGMFAGPIPPLDESGGRRP